MDPFDVIYSGIRMSLIFGFIFYCLFRLRNYILVKTQPITMNYYHNRTRLLKKELFQHLMDHERNLADQQFLRVLEVGAADGKNLDFYPPSTRIVVVDPEEEFRNKFLENVQHVNSRLSSFPLDGTTDKSKCEQRTAEVKLEYWYSIGIDDPRILRETQMDSFDQVHEHLADLLTPPLGHFDAFVSTFTMCYVGNMEQVFLTATKLVKPGGLLLLLEHVCPPGLIARTLCFLLEPFWTLLMRGCRFSRKPLQVLQQHTVLNAAWEIIYHKYNTGGWLSELYPAGRCIGLVARRVPAESPSDPGVGRKRT